MGTESGNGNDLRKTPNIDHHAIGWIDWILQHNVSLCHCLNPFTSTIETL